jgi:hypothetical protein
MYVTRSRKCKFESFPKRLQSGIDKGLDGKLVAFKIKEVEVKREKEVEVVFLALAIKLE